MIIFRLIALVFLPVSLSTGLKAEWIEMSESASLPMSKKYRDDLRDRLERLDVERLSGKDRQAIENLKRLLREDEGQPNVSYLFKVLLPMIAIVGGITWYIRNRRNPGLPGPSPDDLRFARVRKYQ